TAAERLDERPRTVPFEERADERREPVRDTLLDEPRIPTEGRPECDDPDQALHEARAIDRLRDPLDVLDPRLHDGDRRRAGRPTERFEPPRGERVRRERQHDGITR